MYKTFVLATFLLAAVGFTLSYGDEQANLKEAVLPSDLLWKVNTTGVLEFLRNRGNILRVPVSIRIAPISSIFNQSFIELLTSRYRWAQRLLSESSGRSRRSLIIPGTNYCGVGNDTTDITSVGDMSDPNRCCQEHDTCPFTIQGFQTKYNFYNFRFYTISHCECDDIFHTCLKMRGSDQANFVGRLYFNYIGMKCFAFRQETVCAEREWWGRCKRQKVQMVAELRDPLAY